MGLSLRHWYHWRSWWRLQMGATVPRFQGVFQATQQKEDWRRCLSSQRPYSFNPPFGTQCAQMLIADKARRSAEFDTVVAWEAIRDAASPDDILSPQTNPHARRLYDARRSVNDEVERCTHVQPKWSGDSHVALLRITSRAQVHPVSLWRSLRIRHQNH